MIVSEHEREGGGHTTQFMDAAGDKELLISAWPYTQLDLTLGKHRRTERHIGPIRSPRDRGCARDDTFTVLFQKNGIRYGVITLSEDEAWLTDILTTWQFH